MASLFSKIVSFGKSSEGKKLISAAEKAASDPKTQKQVESVAEKAAEKL